MTDPLPESGQTRTLRPVPGRPRLRAVAGACVGLFFVLLVAAWLMHPDIPAPLAAGFIVLPLVAVVLGVIARAGGVIKVAAVLLVLVAGVAVLLPNLCRAREPANQIKCASNLKQIGLALAAYTDRHGGQFPPGLDVLMADADIEITPDVLVCPSTQDVRATGATPAEVSRQLRDEPECLSYVYVGAGLTRATATPDRVVAYDKPHNHGDKGVNVLYGDGRVGFVPWKEARRVIPGLETDPRPATSRPAGR